MDEDDKGNFDRKMFMMAMHLLKRIREGESPPAMIPHEIRKCTDYFMYSFEVSSSQ